MAVSGGHKYKAVLILGAGISKPYGFPLGPELLERIGSLRDDPAFQEYARTRSLSDGQLQRFFKSTTIPFHGTIDEYLRRNPSHLPVGLPAIAWAIMSREKTHDTHSVFNDGSFYWILFNFVKLNPEAGDQTREVSIITLNYDRSLEYWLNEIVDRCVSEADMPEARRRRSALNIHHLHGSLGSLEQLPFGTKPSASIVDEAAARLRTIHIEDDEFKASYAAATQTMRNAGVVCILGCSYDTKVFGRLFPGVRDGRFFAQSGIQRICGTVFGHNEEMQSRIQQIFGSSFFPADRSEYPAQFLPRATMQFENMARETASGVEP